MTERKCISSDEATTAEHQHTKPCSDCPWSRRSLRGWLGSMSIEDWLQAAHSETLVDCHTIVGMQCAGIAIYRRNVCKQIHDERILVLPSDNNIVFKNPMEFHAHHKSHKFGI